MQVIMQNPFRIRGQFTFQEWKSESRNGISVPFTPQLQKIKFPIKNQQNHFDTHFEHPPLKSSISPLFTPSKIANIPPKIPSNPYKSSTFSNSTENTIFNKEITHQNHLFTTHQPLKTPVKSILFNHIKSTNNAYLSKS